MHYTIYRRDDFSGKIKTIVHFEEMEHFFWHVNESIIKDHFGYTDVDRRDKYYNFFGETPNEFGYIACSSYRYFVEDWEGKYVTPDRLIGDYRKWQKTRKKNVHWSHRRINRNGWKKPAYAGYRQINTKQERTWNNAWDDEEFAPKGRAARNNHNLPDSWWDIMGHNDKCWKTQSKRKRQWKSHK